MPPDRLIMTILFKYILYIHGQKHKHKILRYNIFSLFFHDLN